MKCAVVYYSLGGNTAAAAKKIAALTGADVFALREKNEKRRGVWGFVKSGFQAAFKMRARLERDYASETKAYDSLYVGTPVWAGHCAPAVNTFVQNADLSGKDVTLFFLCASPEEDYRPAGIDALSAAIRKKGGTVSNVYVWRGGSPGKPARAQEIGRQAEEALGKKP